MKLEVKDTIPCSICGGLPVLQGGYGWEHRARLVCPNYKNPSIPHGNLSYDTQHLPRGFTPWHCEDWWSKEQAEENGVPKLINVWNIIHSRKENLHG